MMVIDGVIEQFYYKKVNKVYSNNIVIMRAIACIYVLGTHLYGWYIYAFNNETVLSTIYTYLNSFFQPYGETNPAVITFIVISGYCIHRNGLRIDTKSPKTVFIFIYKRIVRLAPVFLVGLLLGILCYRYSFNPEFTKQMTMTESISVLAVIEKVLGICVFFPHRYFNTYLGNVALITVSVELYCYLIYACIFVLVSDNRIGKIKINIIVVLTLCYVISFLAVILCKDTLLFTWWNNASIYSLFPVWLIGAFKVDKEVLSGKHHLCLMVLFIILSIASNILGFSAFTMFICEVKKIIFAFLISCLIRFLDECKIQLNQPSLLKIGEQSYSIYAIYAPICVFLLGMKQDLITIIVCIVVVSWLVYYFIEKKVTYFILNKIIECPKE